MLKEPIWIDQEALIALHGESLSRFGGPEGLRDRGMLESALGRPRNQQAYSTEVDLAALAAAYAFGISRNHPFVDGNKRAAFIAMDLFLILNGHELVVEETDAIATFLALAAGDLGEDGLADWIRSNMQALPD
jgi:death on curing protein